MDLHVIGRHIHIADDFRAHIDERVGKLEHIIGGERRVDVIVAKGSTADEGVRVEVTLHAKGPIIRSEAAHSDKFIAFDHAFDKLVARVRKALERRRSGRRRAVVAAPPEQPVVATPVREPRADESQVPQMSPAVEESAQAEVVELPDSPIEVRVKRHTSAPMSVEDAVYEMEMVGHDFFLYVDEATGAPSVLYKRRGWSYGVIHLQAPDAPAEASAQGAPATA